MIAVAGAAQRPVAAELQPRPLSERVAAPRGNEKKVSPAPVGTGIARIPASRRRHHCAKCQAAFFSAASHLPLLQPPGRHVGHLFIRHRLLFVFLFLARLVLSNDTRLEWKVPTRSDRRTGAKRQSVHRISLRSDVDSAD